MIRGAIGAICIVGAVVIGLEKDEVWGYEWYTAAYTLLCVGAFLLWVEWKQWRERRSLWGTRKNRPDFTVDDSGSNLDLFPDD